MSIVNVTQDDLKENEIACTNLIRHYNAVKLATGKQPMYSIYTYGCQLNESDSEKLCGVLEQIGFERTENDSEADFIIFNTCAIRENAEDRLFGNLGELKRIKKANKNLIIAVCGCMMKVSENVDRIKKSFNYVDIVFDPQQIHLLPTFLWKHIETSKQNIEVGDLDYIVEDDLIPVKRARKFRAFVPIMYGCNNFCTYCIVPYTRGRERSRDFDSIVSELEDLAKQGYKEVMLLGQNVNSYSSPDGKTFPDLLRRAAQIDGFSRVRFMSSHPKDISDEVIDIMAEYPNIEKHLHLPLQSGSDRILKRMNRTYDSEKYLRTAMRFRELVPEGTISTDIIVGFPGETEEDFEDTLKMVEKVRYDSAFTFQYSVRPGTPAARFEDQVPHDVVTERFGRLLKLQNDIVFESNKKEIGNTLEVLIEGKSSTADDILSGRTKNNRLVNFTMPEELKEAGKSSEDYEGRICMVKITSARPFSIDGEMVSIE